jgi:hypothetical protein
MADLTLVQGETRDIYITLADRDGPVPPARSTPTRTGCSSTAPPSLRLPARTCPNGRVKFAFDATDTAAPGVYSGDVKAVRANSTFAVFPSERPHAVEIRETV